MPSLTSPGGVLLGGGAWPAPGTVTLTVGAIAAAGKPNASPSANNAAERAQRRLRNVAVGDRTLAGRRNVAQVLRHHALRITRWRCLPLGASLRELVVGDVQLDQKPVRVDRDGIALADQRDRPAGERFGRDVSDDHAPCATGEA